MTGPSRQEKYATYKAKLLAERHWLHPKDAEQGDELVDPNGEDGAEVRAAQQRGQWQRKRGCRSANLLQ